ncbi:hypothetical protein [Lentibacter sp. XHP0401]|jgi:glucose dehydrogenase|uniref:hypothetical protein n=1 Tax=Lentibacter sp. XHP0401 TaxID=2984334 RepID=UPI0021E78D76|nr:hypothetical protein [Lentibacter sp. XHP0401]MCV2893120.1 hypothetical protein [Lentibacter sp. XHP0401]
MNSLRELVLILSCFTWLGAAIYMALGVVSLEVAKGTEAAEHAGMGKSPYLFFAGLALFILTSLLWKNKKDA